MLDGIQPRKNWENVHHQTVWQKPRRRWRLKLAVVLLLILAAGFFAGSKIFTFAQKIMEGSGNQLSFSDFFIGSDKPLQGEDAGQIRILLLGIGGAGHDGPNLTDTMILATINLPKNDKDRAQVSLISIPRDLAVDIPGRGRLKINSAYAYGQMDGKNGGAALTLKTAENALGINIPYYGLADFLGFEKIIDDLGGVDVTVDRTFADNYFPDNAAGYLPSLTFEAGPQHMNGTRALQFVRSRHGNNTEGTDFARSRRQEKILKAVKEKVARINLVADLPLINRILGDLSDHIRTNLAPWEMKKLYDLTHALPAENIFSSSIDVESGLVCDRINETDGAYILVPCGEAPDNFQAIQNFVKNQFVRQVVNTETATVEIQNASGITGLGQSIGSRLKTSGLTVTAGNFLGGATYQDSIIYDNTGGKKPRTLQYLKDITGARAALSPFPFKTAGDKPDFVIVVAADLKD